MALPCASSFLGKGSAPDDSFEMNTFKPVSSLQQINSRLTPCGEEKPLPTLRISTDKDTHNQKELHLKDHQHGQSGRFDDRSSLPTSMFSKYKDGQLQREDHMNGQLTPFNNENPPSTSRTAITLDISAEHIQKELSAEPHQHDEETPMLPSTFFSQGKTFAETYQHGQSNPFEPPDPASADTDVQVCRELSTKDYQHGQSMTKLEIASLLQNAAATLEDAKLIHDHIARHGPAMDRYVGNLFISLYGKHGAVIEARSVFDSMPERCVVSWNAMIAAYSQQGFAVEALQLFQLMQQEDVKAAGATFVSSLNACAELVDLPQGKAIHKMITSSAILPNSFVQTALINMYGKCGALQEAKLVFDDIDPHDVVSWTSIISACSRHGHGEESLELFEQMQKEGIEPNTITFVSVLSSFESPVFLSYGKLIHLYIAKEGLESDVTVATALINMYSKCGDLQCASSLFEKLHLRNVVSWSAMVGAYVEHGCSNIALQLFQEMQLEGIQPNKVTLLHALDACGELAALDKGHTMYTNIINWGMETDVVLGTSIINMFHQSGAMEDAFAVFSRIYDRNVFVWNSMIGAYAQRGDSEKVLEFFQSMQQEGGSPDEFTFLSVLSACTSLHALQEGEATHACIIDSGLELDTVVGTGLLNMYGKCKSLRKACILFDKIAVLDIICFNALIGAFVQQGKDKGALQLYHKMLKQGFKPDAVTYVNILSACANLVGQAEGEAIHASIIESGFCNHSSDQCAKTSDTATTSHFGHTGHSWDKQSDLWGTGTTSEHMANRKCREHDDSKWNNSEVPIANALISMYGSCGDMDSAFLVFNRMRCRDVVSWNALIAALTEQGHAQEALQIFQKMHLELVTPNDVTFGSILAACSRAGLVKEAQGYFSSMIEDYRISPTIEHCRCMIDLFARAGQLDDAEDFIANSQLRTNALAWMTLLSSCRLYGETDRGIRAAEIVIELDPQNSTPYVLLLNIYASAGRWDDVEKLKQRMREKGLKGPAGSSCVGIEKTH